MKVMSQSLQISLKRCRLVVYKGFVYRWWQFYLQLFLITKRKYIKSKICGCLSLFSWGRPLIIAFGLANQIDCLHGMGMIEIAFRYLRKDDNKNRALKKSDNLFIPPEASSVSRSNDVKLWRWGHIHRIPASLGPTHHVNSTAKCEWILAATPTRHSVKLANYICTASQKCVIVLLFGGWWGWNVWQFYFGINLINMEWLIFGILMHLCHLTLILQSDGLHKGE